MAVLFGPALSVINTREAGWIFPAGQQPCGWLLKRLQDGLDHGLNRASVAIGLGKKPRADP
ncbi:MAG TPA: hypothetical protein VFG62_04395 [Rhodopila sp.]|nr:hypothetical protein [Rhodopila sp.]